MIKNIIQSVLNVVGCEKALAADELKKPDSTKSISELLNEQKKEKK